VDRYFHRMLGGGGGGRTGPGGVGGEGFFVSISGSKIWFFIYKMFRKMYIYCPVCIRTVCIGDS
jgi:hypothetical protein